MLFVLRRYLAFKNGSYFCKHYRSFCKSSDFSGLLTPGLNNAAVRAFVDKLGSDASSFFKFSSFIEQIPSIKKAKKQSALDLCSKIVAIRNELLDLEAFANNQKSEHESVDLCKLAADDIHERSSVLFREMEELTEYVYPAVGAELDAATLEISAGVGGQEAMIWANDLFQMYEKVIPNLGMKFNALECDSTEIGGARKAFATISGPEAYKILRFEGGIHRVQRVPRTERLGRIHTSTAAVVIMPLPSEIQVVINPSDLTINTFRSSGPGGQHVNRTDSAVRIVHNPSGLIVTCQEERSQHKNRELAMSKLRAILYERQLDSQLSNERAKRRLQAGTKARSEKIRTYNYPRRKVTDHRLLSDIPGTHDLDDAINGGQTLVDIIEALQTMDREDRVMSMVQDFNAFK